MISPVLRNFRNRSPQIYALIVGFALTGWAAGARSQGFDATNLREPADLAAGWLVHAGDDPAYARPDFDDSAWTPFNAATDDLGKLFPRGRPEVVWYRLHVKVAPDQTGLALLETDIESAFEIYSNGVLLLKAWQSTPFGPYNSSAEMLLPIPKSQIVTGGLVIALRVHTSFRFHESPGYHSSSLMIGQEGVLRDHMWFSLFSGNAVRWLGYLSCFAICIGALLLYLTQRQRTEYLWLFLETLCLMPGAALSVYSVLHIYPVTWDILELLCELLLPYFLMRMYCAFVGYRVGWKLNVLAALTVIGGLYRITLALGTPSGFWLLVTYTPWVVLLAAILPAIMIRQTLRGRYLEGTLLVPLLLQDFGYVSGWVFLAAAQIPSLRNQAFRLFNHLVFLRAGPFTLDFVWFGATLANFLFGLIILVRSNRMSRQQALLESEMASAREVQQVILPDAVESIPGFRIESVYEPAREVGGDFFQIVPLANEGFLLVVGDVAGKGLPAAMLVSVLVGAIRTAARYDHAPAAVLGQLNERLVGRANGGFSTALAALFAADGSVLVANAGHLPPYLDGREVELKGALPLGIDRGAAYEAMTLQLEPGGRLTFYSDGVIEAQNKSGELFGFERGREISTQPAKAIAGAAMAFGQQDDITVITVERVAVGEKREVVGQTIPVVAQA